MAAHGIRLLRPEDQAIPGSILKFAGEIYGTGFRFKGRVMDWASHERISRFLGADG